MTTLQLIHAPAQDAVGRLVALLQRYRDTSPVIEAELALQQSLTHTLAEHRIHSERALTTWRAALSRRWECEVSAQRVYRRVQRQLSDYYGADTAYVQLIAPAHADSSCTASDLLQEVRRLDAVIELLTPHPPFAAEALTRLRLAGNELADAIERSLESENERRSMLTEQRIANNLYERAYDRARRMLAHHIGDQALSLPPAFPSDPTP